MKGYEDYEYDLQVAAKHPTETRWFVGDQIVAALLVTCPPSELEISACPIGRQSDPEEE